MRPQDTIIALVAASPLASCHSLENPALEGLQKRAGAGSKCGPAGGNAVCDDGLCCSEAGVCGTGGDFCTAPGCLLAFGPACDGNKRPSGADTSNTPRPRFGSVPFGVDVSSCTVPGKLALTFDDGPYIYTTALLDLLKKNNARATFFVTGNNAGKGAINDPNSGYAPILQRMIAEGHQIGSHTWSHENLDSLTPELRRKQFIYNEIALVGVLGVFPAYFRPPYTVCNADCYAELGALGYKVVNYDVDPKDWEDGGAESRQIYTSAIDSGRQSEYLVLAHDVQPFTVNEFAQFMIDKAHAAGFEIVPAGECLGEPESQWYRDPKTGAARSARGAGPVEEPEPEPTKKTTTGGTISTTTQKKVVITPTPVPTFKVTELPRNSTTAEPTGKSGAITTPTGTGTSTNTGTSTGTGSPQETGAAGVARPVTWLGLLGLGAALVMA
jgi:peptidoglycan/xylan/chitin deacetylase (PgdA/CDA1 family)